MIDENEPALAGSVQPKENKTPLTAQVSTRGVLGRGDGLSHLSFLPKNFKCFKHFLFTHPLYAIWKYRRYLVTGYISKWKNMQKKFSKDIGSRLPDQNKLFKDMHRGQKADRRKEVTGQNGAGCDKTG
ncbi:hypothetical protein HJG60_009526 [Phyllostomus discolor]|uniref:Uncharacterized protein n=1 Tax=Phyllostomus discolor TaxID=89673 RepID=A0A833YC60_9CHIR|nr:hypothetical protein HJG60_009526 [Phyllostomus discolor]